MLHADIVQADSEYMDFSAKKEKQVRKYYKPGKGVRNNCNSQLLQLLRTLRSTSRGMLIFVCVCVCVIARWRHYW